MRKNPVIEVQDKLSVQTKKTEYPVNICCVVNDYADANTCKTIAGIKAHTLESGAMYTTRMYDSRKIIEDRYEIQRLPAFHIYIKNRYIKTFYPNTRPLQHVDESIERYIKREEEKKIYTARWSNLYSKFVNWLKHLTHRNTRMEKYERDLAIDKARLEAKKKAAQVESWS